MCINAIVVVFELITRKLVIRFVLYKVRLASYSWYGIWIISRVERQAINDL